RSGFSSVAFFPEARFHRGANFKRARLSGGSFEGVSSSSGSLSFDDAIFPDGAEFDEVDVAGTLSFNQATTIGACPRVRCGADFSAENLDAHDLRMPLRLVKR